MCIMFLIKLKVSVGIINRMFVDVYFDFYVFIDVSFVLDLMYVCMY